MPKRAKVYGVAKGRTPGVYKTWKECEQQTKGFAGAVYKGFFCQNEANRFVETGAVATTSSSSRSSSSSNSNSNGRSAKRVCAKKFFAVARGKSQGIFETWDECQAQVQGVSRALFKSFTKRSDAEGFIQKFNEQENLHADDGELNIENTWKSESFTPQSNENENATVIHLAFDGGSRGNPGIGGAGAELRWDKTKFVHVRYFCGRCTNNYAEYTGVLEGLKHAKRIIDDLSDKSICLYIKGDSQIIINQLNGYCECKKSDLIPLYKECRSIVQHIKNQCTNKRKILVSFTHVYREHNKVADKLANEAMDAQKTSVTTSNHDEQGGHTKCQVTASTSNDNDYNDEQYEATGGILLDV